MTNISICKATEQDSPAILGLYRDADIDDTTGFTVEEAREHFASLSLYPYFRVFMALSDGVVAGTYELVILDNMAKRGRKSGLVEDVAVSPDHQRTMRLAAVGKCTVNCWRQSSSSENGTR